MDFDGRNSRSLSSIFRERLCPGGGRVCADPWLVVCGGDKRWNGVRPGDQSGGGSTRGTTWTADTDRSAAPGHHHDQAWRPEADEGSSCCDDGATGEWRVGEWGINDRIHSGRRTSENTSGLWVGGSSYDHTGRLRAEADQLRGQGVWHPGRKRLSVGDYSACGEVGHCRL